MMEKCFDSYAENGLAGTGTQALASKIGISYTITTPLIFIFVGACVHYLKPQSK